MKMNQQSDIDQPSLTPARNQKALTDKQIEDVRTLFNFMVTPDAKDDVGDSFDGDVLSEFEVKIDFSRAKIDGTRTTYADEDNIIYIGTNIYPVMSGPQTANATMSMMACLAHELAHAQRKFLGYRRNSVGRGELIDEAETSLHASFFSYLNPFHREQLVRDATERLEGWHSWPEE